MNYTPQDRVFRTQVYFSSGGSPCMGLIDTVFDGDDAVMVFEWAEFLDGNNPGESPKKTYRIHRDELQPAPITEESFEFIWRTEVDLPQLEFVDEAPPPGYRANPANFFQSAPDAHGSV